MLYNIDFTISALVVLVFLFAHYVRNGKSAERSSTMFPVFMLYVFGLGCLDIAIVLLLENPAMPRSTCLIACTTYMALETFAAPLLTFFVPMVFDGISKRETICLHVLFLPALLVIFYILIENPTSGMLFTIDDMHRFAPGPYCFLLQFEFGFYLLTSAAIITANRKRIDSYRIMSMWLMIAVGSAGVLLQAAFGSIRTTVATCTLLILEMYLSYQIPEKRFDPLTGLFSRNAFTDATAKMIARRPYTDFVMICSNIKEFKAINELYGPQMGDGILTGIANEMKKSVISHGTIGRLQGDHFAFCLPESEFDLNALLADTAREELHTRFGCEVHLAFGIYRITERDSSVESMCDRARLAIADIKDSRLSRYAYYNESHGASFLEAHEIAGDMEASIHHGDFEVYLQPIYDLHSFEIAAAEALVRWNHPVKGFLMPDSFIPLFERNGLVTELDLFVLETVCQHIRTCQDEGLGIVPVSVNVSRADLHPEFASHLIAVVDRFEIPHETIRLEITETAYIESTCLLDAIVDDLHKEGFTVMLDDFGSGYSSLSLLEQSPFDIMKIDRSFLEDTGYSTRSRTVLDYTIALANELELPVVCEGIETLDQAMLLRSLGSEYGQGFYFSKPLPMNEFKRML
jgi:diguanylate cyclase (GGDEF)-like protein